MTDSSHIDPPQTWRRLMGIGVGAMGLAMLSACAWIPPQSEPSVTSVNVHRMGLKRDDEQPERAAAGAWWPAFDDAGLAHLIEQALDGSPTIQDAAARLQLASAQSRLAHASLLPSLDASAEVDRQRFTANGLYPPPLGGATLNTGTLQLESQWELDLFGKQRAELRAAVGQQRAAQAEFLAVQMLLSTQVAHAYVELGRLQAQQSVLERTLKQREEILRLIRERVSAGLDTKVELRQGEGALPEVKVQLEALHEQVMLQRHALAVLCGMGPQALDQLDVELGRLKVPAMPQSLPADLLARRTDVQAARWRVQAQGQMVQAARADYYPNIELTSYLGYSAFGLSNVLMHPSLQWGLMPAIHLPLFDGHRRDATLSGQEAERDRAIAGYNATVLQAVQDVVDQLSSLQSLELQRKQQQQAQERSESAYALAVERYQAGLGNYLSVLSAESSVLNQRRLEVDLRSRVLSTDFALVRAVGGGLEDFVVASAGQSSSLAADAAGSQTPKQTQTQATDAQPKASKQDSAQPAPHTRTGDPA